LNVPSRGLKTVQNMTVPSCCTVEAIDCRFVVATVQADGNL
jgi:hypothetical protein